MKYIKITALLILAFCFLLFPFFYIGELTKPFAIAILVNLIYLVLGHRAGINKVQAAWVGKFYPTKYLTACFLHAFWWIPYCIRTIDDSKGKELLLLYLIALILTAFNFGLASNKDTELPPQ